MYLFVSHSWLIDAIKHILATRLHNGVKLSFVTMLCLFYYCLDILLFLRRHETVFNVRLTCRMCGVLFVVVEIDKQAMGCQYKHLTNILQFWSFTSALSILQKNRSVFGNDAKQAITLYFPRSNFTFKRFKVSHFKRWQLIRRIQIYLAYFIIIY